jgi:hypothetical protein
MNTRGLSMLHDKKLNIWYLDSAGYDIPTPINKYYDDFIQQLRKENLKEMPENDKDLNKLK